MMSMNAKPYDGPAPRYQEAEDIHWDDRTTWRSYAEGPRWSGFSTALRNRVWEDSDLDLVSCETERTFLRETTRFVVTGWREAVERLQADILDGLEHYNRGRRR